MNDATRTLQEHSSPLEPLATDVAPILPTLSGVRAVMFDIYGTLFISGSGDIGTSAAAPGAALAAACHAVGLDVTAPADEGVKLFTSVIASTHAAARAEGVPFPEVDIVAVWDQTLREMARRDWVPATAAAVDRRELAVQYEIRVNPVWPMPGVEACLRALARTELKLGIISNAQFFTPLLFSALLKKSPAELGFSESLSHYSYRYGHAKPGEYLFRRARASLREECAIEPAEVLFVGNDMLNDICGASRAGFRTALFAGDQRSLRWRHHDERVQGLQPDAIVTHLEQIIDLLNFH